VPKEQRSNHFVDRSMTFKYFFIRKYALIQFSSAFVAFPGGFGTLDEVTDVLGLLQTRHLQGPPLILFGRSYWQGWLDWMADQMVPLRTIETQDLQWFHFADTPEEVQALLQKTSPISKIA